MSNQHLFANLDISSQQLETFQKDILIPMPHVLSQLQSEAKFDHIQQKITKNNNLLQILDHKEDCFRSYILTGENLPLLVLLKPRNSESEKSEKIAIPHESLIYFVENVKLDIFFKKRDKDTSQVVLLPSQSPYFFSNSYIETPRISQREIESIYIMNSISTIHSYAYDETTQTLLLLMFIPIHLPSEQVNEKLFIDLELKCESQTGQAKQLQETFTKNEEKFIDFLLKERDVFYKPPVYECKMQKNIILVNPFIISYDDHQLGDMNYIQISIKYNNQMENYIDQYRKHQVFLKKCCKLSEQEQILDQTFLLDQLDFVLSKSYSTFIQEKSSNAEAPVMIKTLDNYFTYKLLQNKATNEKIKIYPFCEYTFVLHIEKQQNKDTQDLQNYKFLIKCDQCKQNFQLNLPPSSPKKNSLILLQPVVKQKSNNSLVRQMSNKSFDESSQASGHSLKSTQNTINKQSTTLEPIRALAKSQSAAQFTSSSLKLSTITVTPAQNNSATPEKYPIMKRITNVFTRNQQNTIKEFDEIEENEQPQERCDCQILMNVGLNLNNSTPLIIRWTHENTFQKMFTISQYKIIWSHKGNDILMVKLHRRKDHLLQVNTFYHLKMTVKNLTSKPLDLNCNLPLKISSKLNANDIDSKVVAICKESILELGIVNPNEEVQTSFEYYLLSEGSFRFNHIIFYDKLTQRDIKVDINIFELVK